MCWLARSESLRVSSNYHIGVKQLKKARPTGVVEPQGPPCRESPNETPGPPSPARIIIADDHDLVRESTRSLLDSEPDLQIIDEAKDGQETIELTRLQRPDLVLMDVGMPKVNGFEATRTIKEELPTTKVLIVSAYEDPVFVSDAVRAGADGYVLKLSPIQEILDAIRGALRGESQYA
jgi:DNA-binding NarL/FixJ family response regulator